MHQPFVSIITPFYNAEKYLADCIRSVLEQTFTNWELILIDDGSTDNSYTVAGSFKDDRIKLIKQENGGQCAATNFGLKNISGELILFLDADDLLHKNKLEVQVRALAEFPNSVAIGKWAFFKENVEGVTFQEEPIYFTGTPINWLHQLWSNETMMPNNGYLIPKPILVKAGTFYDETLLLNIDFEYFTRIVLAAEQVIYCPESICYYRKGVAGAKTTSPKLEKKCSSLTSRSKAIGYLLKTEDSDESRYASRMAITILTYSFPEILSYSQKAMRIMGLGNFESFGGKKFKLLSKMVGFPTAIRIKNLLDRFQN